jgi:YVTN family beta-propeller protein
VMRAIRSLPSRHSSATALVLAVAISLGAFAARADYNYSVYQGTWTQLPNFDALTPTATGTTPTIGLSVTPLTDHFGLVFTGTLTVQVAGTYTFSTTTDDGSDLRIDSTTVVNNDGQHGATKVTGAIALTAGTHSLRIRYFEWEYDQSLSVSYAPPGGAERTLPANGVLDPPGATGPAATGTWGSVITWPHIAITAAALTDGRILTWSSTETNAFPSSTELTRAAVFDPATTTFTTVNNNFHDMFCAGVSTLEDGRIVAAGGNPYDTRTSVFNPATLTWSALANMAQNRWYGTLLALPSNELFATFANAAGNTSERYNPATNGWTNLAGATMQDLLNEQNAENGQTTVNSSGGLEWWGQMAVAPDGRVVHGGPTQTWHMFDPRNSGAVQSLGQPAGTRNRMWANTVTYGAGKVLIVGGSDRTQNPPTTNAAYKIDLNGPTPVISTATPMTFSRALANAVTLPNGEVIVIGGNNTGVQFTDAGSVFAAEIWNPTTDQWRTVASMSVGRTYHSTALLMKDARVLSAGGGACGSGCTANHLDGQIYTPPYLYASDGTLATRPTIDAAPAIGEAGSAITVVATGAIAKFSMVRLSATTHAMNTDQRYLPIAFTNNGDGSYHLQLESNANVLLPGYYWIFALDTAGVPSIGRTFQVLRNDGSPAPGLEAEGESAVLAGTFTVGLDAAARNGRYISLPSGTASTSGPTSPHRASLEFAVTLPGQYKIEGTVLAPNSGANAFWITVDGLPASGFVWEMPVSAAYQADFVSDTLTATDPVIVVLDAGVHTVEVIHREAGTRLDWMRLVYVGPPPPPPDSDGDGVPDDEDAFPNDPTEWADTDGDGHGDNSDAFPSDPTRWLPEHGVTPVAAPHNSTTLIVETSSGADRIWNVNPDNHSVTVTSAAGAVVAEIQVGDRPWSLAKAPLANEVFVANKGSASISVISTQTFAVLRTIALPVASQPHGLAFSNTGDVLYVALEALARVDKLAPATGALQGSAALAGRPRHLAVSADGTKLYVTNFVTPPLPGESTAVIDMSAGGAQLFVVNTGAMSLAQTIAFDRSDRTPSELSGPGMPNYLNAPVLFGSKAYVPSKQDNLDGGVYRGNFGMVFDQTVRAVTSVIDLPSGTELTGQRIDHDNAGVATGAALSGEGRYLFVALETAREVAVYDTQLGFQLTRLAVGRAPQGVAFSSDGRTLYVHNFMDRTVKRFDVTNLVALGSAVAPLLGTVNTVAAEQMSAQVLLGKQLFYDAADDRLAQDNYISCASCHNDGDGDGRVWDLTGFGEGLRNTVDLRGRGGMNNGWLHWTGNFDEVQDFEGQIRALSGGTGLMSNALFNAGTRSHPLGDPKAGLSSDLDALAAYVASLTAAPASPHRSGAGFSASAESGRTAFANHGCGACHMGPPFTDSAPNTRHDVGTIHAGSGERLDGPLDGFDTPTLVGVWATAPYLHDGSAATIAAAIAAHSGITTTPTERAQIAAFLDELNPGDAQPLPEPTPWLALAGGAVLLRLLERRRHRAARR